MSTSLISEYRATQEAIEELQQRLQALSQDQKLQQELEFEQKLRALMAEYGKSLPAIIAILDPQAAKNSRASQPAKASSSRRRPSLPRPRSCCACRVHTGSAARWPS